MQERRAPGTRRAEVVRAALYAGPGNELRRDAPRNSLGQCAAGAPARDYALYHGARRAPGTRGHKRFTPHRRPEGPHPEHFPDADEPARKSGPLEYAKFVWPLRASPLNPESRYQIASSSKITRVESARHGGVLCAFQNGPAIGKDRHFIRRDAKANQEIVLSNVLNHRLQAKREFRKVKGAAPLVNLHRITPTERDVRLSLPSQIGVIVLCAGPAIRIPCLPDRLHAARPNIAGNQPPVKRFGATTQKDRKSTRLNSSHMSISYAVF